MQLCEREVTAVKKSRRAQIGLPASFTCEISVTSESAAALTGYIAKVSTPKDFTFLAGTTRTDAVTKAIEYAKTVLGLKLDQITVNP